VGRWLRGDGVAIAGYPRIAAHHAAVATCPAVARAAALHG
jgi:hypothetical protein